MGDFYVDPRTEEEIPEFYSFVEIGQSLPDGISYEVIEEYDYEIDNPLLIAESFRLTDNFEYVNEYIFPEDIEDEVEICGVIIMVPPDDIDCPPPCVPVLVIDDSQVDPRGKPVYIWECDCSGGGSGNGGTNPPTNDCGCPTYSDQRKPAGCISVENNSTPADPLEGVRKVRVIVKDWRFGKSYKTWTDEEGCWKVNKRCKGRIWMWVEFKNGDSYERCWRSNWKVWQLLKPVKDYVGHFWGPNYSDIEVIYWHWGTETETQAQRYWGAATVNNEVQIYLDETSDIDRPPYLDIYMQPNSRAGAAIMAGYWPTAVVTTLIPDLSIGINFGTRDRQDELSYHEIGHSSHYAQVGNGWWSHLMVQEVANSIEFGAGPNGITFNFDGDPWGDGDEPDAGYVLLAESWAENVSTDLTADSQEGDVFENGYIPMGLYEDLMDDTPTENVRLDILDQVNGFSRASMYDALNSSVTNLREYEAELKPALPTGTNDADYHNLFTAYRP